MINQMIVGECLEKFDGLRLVIVAPSCGHGLAGPKYGGILGMPLFKCLPVLCVPLSCGPQRGIAVEERCGLHALRCIRERSHGSRSRRLLTPDGPQKEDLCQRCGSLPALLAASAARSQRRCLRQEIAW